MFTANARETMRIPDFYLHVAILKRFPRPQCSSLSSAKQCLARLCRHSCWRAAGYSLGGIGWSKEDMEPYAHLCQSLKQKSCAVSSWPLFLWLPWAPLDHNPGRWKHGTAGNQDWRILQGQKAKESLWAVHYEPKWAADRFTCKIPLQRCMYTITSPPQRGHLVSGELCRSWWADSCVSNGLWLCLLTLLGGLVEVGSCADAAGLDLFSGVRRFMRFCLNNHHEKQNVWVYTNYKQNEEYIQQGSESWKVYVTFFSFKKFSLQMNII